MLDRRLNRRNFLTTAAFTAAAVSGHSLTRSPLIAALGPKLRLAISDWLPPSLVSDMTRTYFEPLAARLGRDLELLQTDTNVLLGSATRGSIDAIVTSTNFHLWLSPEHSFFSSLPYGLGVEKKMAWLTSPEGRELQDRFFASLNLKPQLLGLGSDQCGSLSTLELSSIEDLRGARIATRDFRSRWFERLGMAPRSLDFGEQGPALESAQLDITEPLPPSAVEHMLARFAAPLGLRYYQTPKLRTAPSVHVLWRASAWGSLNAGERASAETLALSALEQVSRAWQTSERDALERLRGRFRVSSLSNELIGLFEEDALKFRRGMASRSGFSRDLVAAYEKASTSTLRTMT